MDNYYSNWHKSVIQKLDRNYHILDDGILSKSDYTVLFENEEGKRYLPVETIDSINIYSEVTFSAGFFDFMSKQGIRVTIFDKYGNHVGTFAGKNNGVRGTTMLKQAALYLDEGKRLDVAKKIMTAAMHNIRSNLRYYYRQKRLPEINAAIDGLTDIISQMKDAASVNELMIIEARGRQIYYGSFNYFISDENFIFSTRSRRPPLDPVNALISFGNTYLYNRIATELAKTSLDIRIGFVHATNNRDESLNLDISEIFKPIIVDRAIFTLINKKMIKRDLHFENANGGIYMNTSGKRLFIEELERKIYSKINIDGESVSNDTLIRQEVRKFQRMIVSDEKYKPYKYSN